MHHESSSKKIKVQTDVLIIGAGIIGSSVAYNLAKRGIKAVVLDKGGLAGGTSAACDGLVFLQSKSPGIHLEMAMESSKLYGSLREELQYDIEYKASGGLILVETAEELTVMTEVVKKQKDSGLKLELLSGKEARSLEPTLGERVTAAVFCREDGCVNPIKTVFGFTRKAKVLGADFYYHTPVLAIEVKKNQKFSVMTEFREFETRWVVNACGVWAPFIGEMVGLSIPITPRKGQILVSETLAPAFHHVMLCANYIAMKYRPHEAKKQSGVGLSLEQTANGNLLIGSSREFAGYNTQISHRVTGAIARRATGLLPCLEKAKIIRCFAGLRPFTPDGLPILGSVPGIPGFIMAAGHEGDGIALAPITGLIIAQHIGGERPAYPLQRFALSRF